MTTIKTVVGGLFLRAVVTGINAEVIDTTSLMYGDAGIPGETIATLTTPYGKLEVPVRFLPPCEVGSRFEIKLNLEDEDV